MRQRRPVEGRWFFMGRCYATEGERDEAEAAWLARRERLLAAVLAGPGV